MCPWMANMWRECRGFNGVDTEPNFQPNISTFIQNLRKGKCNYSFAEGYHAAQLINNSCSSFAKTGEVVAIEGVSFVLPIRMARMIEEQLRIAVYCELEQPSGDMMPLLDYIDEFDQCSTTSRAVLSFRRLRSFFFIAFAGCGILIAIQVIYIFKNNFSDGNGMVQDSNVNN